MTQHQARSSTRRRVVGIRPAVAALGVALSVSIVAPVVSAAATRGPSTHRGAAHGITIAMADESYGPQLVIGSGPGQGFSLYAITSDTQKSFGCTAAPFHGPGGQTFSCTGPLTSNSSEWPALTTNAAPVAGAGVTQGMLGTVYRKGIGHQVTYGGHPLYVFDNGPGQVTGEGWDEPTLPPDHGIWSLVNPDGNYQQWNQTLTSTVLADGSTTALAALMMTGAGAHAFPVYAFSADTGSTSACGAACARLFPPLLTTGTPGIEGTLAGTLGSITRTDGTFQVTYNGHPLYLDGSEQIARVPGRGFVATGNGNTEVVGGGTFSVVTP